MGGGGMNLDLYGNPTIVGQNIHKIDSYMVQFQIL